MALNWPSTLQEYSADGLEMAHRFYRNMPAGSLELAQHFEGTQMPMASKWPSILYGDVTPANGLELAQHFAGTSLEMA